MKSWQKRYPPYEGAEPYLYFAFADADAARRLAAPAPAAARGLPGVVLRAGPPAPKELCGVRSARRGGADLV